jgi:predicted acylesterase/phospholipase RssA
VAFTLIACFVLQTLLVDGFAFAFTNQSPPRGSQTQTIPTFESSHSHNKRGERRHEVSSSHVLLMAMDVAKQSTIIDPSIPASEVKTKNQKGEVQEITTLEELEHAFDPESGRSGGQVLKSISVKGDTQCVTADHPVAKLLYERKQKAKSLPPGVSPLVENKKDGYKIALAIEGGGMRGCVSAGMVAALYYLGLEDHFDTVYGSSAGSLIGAYFITRQLPYYGPEIYYDILTTAGTKFIDTRRLLRAVGLGLLDPRLLKDVITRPDGKPVLELSYLLETTVQQRKPLNWTKFVEMQEVQPLNVIASGLKSEKAMVFNMKNKSFQTLGQLAKCMHASMLLPGIAGPVMNIGQRAGAMAHIIGNDQAHLLGDGEPLADSLIYEPFPYRSAVKDGATHVLVLRTRPDGVDVTGKAGIFDKFVMRRFFLKKNKLRGIFDRMQNQLHKKRYAEDVLIMNEAAKSKRDYTESSPNNPHLMPIALPPGSPEVTRLENDRQAILEGVRRGFARTYDALVDDPEKRGMGAKLALEEYPDEILNYDPSLCDSNELSAFEVYLTEANPDLLELIQMKQRDR